ncbi:MAG: FAD-binding protein, partial [Bacteroidia bacterium]|nr:FAD-binding protein [Bacteroidia bacterium]
MELELKLLPEKIYDEAYIKQVCAQTMRISVEDIQAIRYLKRSIDARKKPVHYLLKVNVYLKGEAIDSDGIGFKLEHKTLKKKIAVVGFGPAGIFAA